MRALRGLWLALVLTLGAGAAFGQPVALDADGMRRLAYRVMAAGEPAVALAYVDALLQRDAADAQALIIRSQALRALGRVDEARAAARAAWAAAETRPARFGAAMVTAQALSTAGRRTEAQLWLRRAAEVAPTDAAKALARRDFRYVRSRNPWTWRFDLAAAPSSNVNGGSSEKRMDFYGFEVELSGDAQALSGGDVTAGVSGTYALPARDGGRTDLSFAIQMREVWLSDAARALAPQARAGDYDYAVIELGAKRHFRPKDGPWRYALGATAGHNWYGGRDLSDFLRLQADVDRAIGERTGVQASLSGERQWRLDNPQRSADVTSLALGGVHVLDNSDRLSVAVTGRATRSDSAEIWSDALSFRLGWQKAAPLAGVSLGAGVSVGTRNYPRSRYTTGARKDHSLGVDVTAGFDNIDYMGFSPTLDLRATRTKSNVALFESRNLSVTMGIRSSF